MRGEPGGVLPYEGLMGTCSQPGYVFRDLCIKQGIDFITFCLNQDIDFINFCLKQAIFSWTKSLSVQPVRIFYECLKQRIKNRNSVLNWVGKSAIFVLNRVRV